MSRRPRPPVRAVAVAALVALVAGACGTHARRPPASAPGPTPPATTAPPIPVRYHTAATMEITTATVPSQFNPLAAPGPDAALQLIADAVLPSAYVVGPDGHPAMSSTLLTSATDVPADPATDAPQTVVYQINQRATWSDGTPVSGADFVYTWQADSGQARFRDTGGRPYTPASTAGYDLVASVTAPADDPGEVVVRFAAPDPDWRALFSPLLPAHAAAAVGFDSGFTDPVDLVSAGPFVVQSSVPGTDVVLVRNPRWWGPEPNLAALRIDLGVAAPEAATSLEEGQADAALAGLDPPVLSAVAATAGLSVQVTPSATDDDLVFNERRPALAVTALRRAIAVGIDRRALAAAASAAGEAGAAPVGNRALVPGQAGYRDDTGALTESLPGPAAAALAAAGFRLRAHRLYRGRRPVVLSLVFATATPWQAAETAAVTAAASALGITVTTRSAAPAAAAAAVAAGRYDLAVVAAPVAVFASALTPVYGTGGTGNVTGYSSAAMDGLLGQVDTLPDGPARTAAVTAVDRLAWSDAVDVPLLAQPTVLAFQSRYTNLTPDPFAPGPGWSLASWGIPVAT